MISRRQLGEAYNNARSKLCRDGSKNIHQRQKVIDAIEVLTGKKCRDEYKYLCDFAREEIKPVVALTVKPYRPSVAMMAANKRAQIQPPMISMVSKLRYVWKDEA
jgi:hypothetical protein